MSDSFFSIKAKKEYVSPIAETITLFIHRIICESTGQTENTSEEDLF